MNLVSKPTENQFNSRGKIDFLENTEFVFFSTKIGQDVLPLTFKLFPSQRSESVDNANRASPSNNGLQRVCNIFFHS